VADSVHHSGRRGLFKVTALWVAIASGFLGSRAGNAQSRGQGAEQKRGQPTVRLVVRPHVGDTLWMQLDQTVETRSVPVRASPANAPHAGGATGTRPPSTRVPEYGPMRESVTQSVVMRMFAHSLVEASTLQTTSLTATTDSLHVRAGAAGHLTPFRPMALAPEDRLVRIRVTPDGAMSVVDPRPGTAALDASFAGMPPMLPARAVAIGEHWEREIPLPSLSMSGVRADGMVHAEFRLDSLSRNARLAYVSMTGTLRREGASRNLPPGAQVATAGTLRGSLVLDRTRGWITEAETIIAVQSDVIPRAGDRTSARSMDIRLSQRLKVH
jgi:hypothetical protein